MKLLLGPVACQGCGDPVDYVVAETGEEAISGWFKLETAQDPVAFRRHRCPAGPRPIPATIYNPWSADGAPIVFEERLRSDAWAPRAEAIA
jgi:hypothetical protein